MRAPRTPGLALAAAGLAALAAAACLPPDAARGDDAPVATDAGHGGSGGSSSGGGASSGGGSSSSSTTTTTTTSTGSTTTTTTTSGTGGAPGAPSVAWALRFGSAAEQTADDVAVDAAGNAFVLGRSAGPLVVGGTPLAASNAFVFVARVDADGTVAWARRIGGGYTAGGAIAVGPDGTVHVVGHFRDEIAFDVGDVPSVTSAGDLDAFVATLAADGTPASLRRFGSAGNQLFTSLAVGADGTLAIGGHFDGSFAIDGTTLTPTPGGNSPPDALVAWFTAGGALAWARGIGGKSPDNGAQIALSTAGVAVTAHCGGQVDFGDGPVACPGMFLASFDAKGGTRFARVFGGGTTTRFVGADDNGDVVLAGTFAGTIDLGAGSPPLVADGEGDVFVARFGADGDTLWGRRIGGSGAQSVFALATDADGGALLTGSFHERLDLGALGGGLITAPAGTGRIYALKIDASAELAWSVALASPSGGVEQVGRGLRADASGAVALVGDFAGTVQAGATTATSAGVTDVLVTRLVP